MPLTHTHTHTTWWAGTRRYISPSVDFLVPNEDNTGRHTNNPDGLPPHPD